MTPYLMDKPTALGADDPFWEAKPIHQLEKLLSCLPGGAGLHRGSLYPAGEVVYNHEDEVGPSGCLLHGPHDPKANEVKQAPGLGGAQRAR